MRERWLTKMKTWQTTYLGKPFILYGNTEQECRDKYSSCIDEGASVIPYDNKHELACVQKIRNNSKLLAETVRPNGYEKREIREIDYFGNVIRLQLSKDLRDDKYYNLCYYQIHNGRFISPITWTMTSAEQFCSKFHIGDDIVKQEQGFVVTPKEIKKIKPVKFYNKDGVTYWRDVYGYFYIANKIDLPNKRNKEEWQRFHDNPDAVYVEYSYGIYGYKHYNWFDSEDVFMEYWKNVCLPDTPSSSATPRYEIKKCGYKKIKPEERKVIFRLPYYPVEVFDDEPPEMLANAWHIKIDSKWYSDNGMHEILVDVIKTWREYQKGK